MNISKITMVSFRAETQAPQHEQHASQQTPTVKENNKNTLFFKTQNTQQMNGQQSPQNTSTQAITIIDDNNTSATKTSKIFNAKNAPYIIGGIGATVATVMGIAGYRKGWFSRAAKQTIKEGEEILSGAGRKTEPTFHPVQHEPKENVDPISKPNNTNKLPDEELLLEMSKVDDTELLKPSLEKQKTETPTVESQSSLPKEMPEIEGVKEAETVNRSAVENMEKVETSAAKTETPEVSDTESAEAQAQKLEENIKKLPAYLTRFMSREEIIKAAKAGKIEMKPLERLKAFIVGFDNSVEGLIQQVNRNFVINNINNNGIYRYKEDYVKAFDSMTKNSNSPLYNSKIEVLENAINLTKPDGQKLIYKFKDGLKGGLEYIEEVPKPGENTAMKIHFYPARYWDYGRGLGINCLAKVEYKNTETNKVIQSITINPARRSFHKVELNDPNTGVPILRMNRTARPGELNYFAVLFEDGKPFVKFNTNKNTVEYLK